MPRVVVDLLRRPELDDVAEVHHRDAVGDVVDDREVVGDEDVGQTELLAQLLHQVDDLRLHRDVQGAHRFVRDDERGVRRERAGDADALALTAGELVRITRGVLGLEADAVEEVLDALLALLPREPEVQLHRTLDELLDRHARVQGAEGVLEDHLHLGAPRQHLLAVEAVQLGLLAIERDVRLAAEDHVRAH